jgi:hypothetical protein
MIILGVSESDGVATGCPGVSISDVEDRRMRHVVASGTAPHVPFDIARVTADRSGLGSYLLLVAPSPFRPHAVGNNENLRYPRRDGTLTRWLTEVEVADLYRDRFRGQAAQRDRVATIGAEARDQVGLDVPWLVVSPVPNHAGSLPISFAGRRQIEQWVRDRHGSHDFIDGFIPPPAVAVAGVGVDRYTITTHYDVTQRARMYYAECHVDGAAAAARQLNSAGGDGTVLADDLVIETARCLRLIGNHAVRCGAHSDAIVKLEVAGTEMHLGYLRDGVVQHYPSRLTMTGVQSGHTIPISALVSGPGQLFTAVRIMLGQVFNAFGRAEVPHINNAGTLRLSHFRGSAIAEWARNNAIPTSDEIVSE